MIECTDAEGRINYKSVAERLGKDQYQCSHVYNHIKRSQKVWTATGKFTPEDQQIIVARVEEARLKGTPSAEVILFGQMWKDIAVELGGRDPMKVRVHWADSICKGQLPSW